MQTVIIFDQGDSKIVFFVVAGDCAKLDGVYVNAMVDKKLQKRHYELEDILLDIAYDHGTGKLNPHETKFPVQAVRDGALVITAGFLP